MKRANWFSALLKSNDRRFVNLLSEHAALTVSSLQVLERFGREREPSEDIANEVKALERSGDEIRRILIQELLQTYATPFDREDLFELSRTIDDILDATNETAMELSMYRIAPPEHLAEMAGVLCDGARHIQSAVKELLDHPLLAAEHAVRAKRSENRVDALYHESVRELFDSGVEMSEIFKSREVYRHLKNSADRIDRAADEISIIQGLAPGVRQRGRRGRRTRRRSGRPREGPGSGRPSRPGAWPG
ncbi:MAG: DUF47 domain-containing protein [Chloroflexota bacterium]